MKLVLTSLLTPHVLVQPHPSIWETHLACEIQALNYTTFSVSEISVFGKYQDTRLAYAHVYVGYETAPMSVP